MREGEREREKEKERERKSLLANKTETLKASIYEAKQLPVFRRELRKFLEILPNVYSKKSGYFNYYSLIGAFHISVGRWFFTGV